LVEDSRAAKRQGGVGAGREAVSEDGSGLGGSVELELEIGSDVSNTALSISELSIGELEGEGSWAAASGSAL
jgi:hypothetical protein